MMWINATRIRDQASLILASCKSTLLGVSSA
jgi:hypothetical protein